MYDFLSQLFRKYSSLIRVAVSGVLISVILLQPGIELGAVLDLVSRLKWKFVAYFFVLRFISIFLLSLRLKYILGIQNLNYKPAVLLRLFFLGSFFNQFLPTQYGGDIAKAFFLSKNEERKVTVYSSIFFDRLIGLVALLAIVLVITFLAFHLLEPLGPVVYALIVIPASLFLLLYFLSHKKFLDLLISFSERLKFESVKKKIQEIFDVLVVFRKDKRGLVIPFLLSVNLQLIFYMGHYCLAMALNMEVPIKFILIFSPVITILTLIPVSLNGIGIRESGYIFFFTSIGATANQAFSLSFLVYFALFLEGIIGAILYLFGKYEFTKE